jgi:glycosyltransferase involved in cell wall biosynthesis
VTNKPLVTIIIPTFNGALFIKESIDSSIGQSYKNIEVIIIDDGSTDNTKDIIEPYLVHENIHYIYQENKGLSGARNTGLKHSKGDYIQFLDSDDLLESTKVAKQIQFLEQNTEYFAVYSDTFYFDGKKTNRIDSYRPFEKLSGLLLDRLISGNFIPVNSILLRKTDTTFDEKLNVLEDWDFWLRLSLQNKKFSYLDEKLSWVRIHQNSMSSDIDKMIRGELIVLDKLKKEVKNNADIHFSKFRRYKKLKEYDLAIKELSKASELDKKYRFKYLKKRIQFSLTKSL